LLLFTDLRPGDCLFHIDPYNHDFEKQGKCKIRNFIVKELDYRSYTIFYLEDGKESHEMVKWKDLGVNNPNDLRTTTLDSGEALVALRELHNNVCLNHSI
tara:strand:+ start:23794 stop:24093 length:300 start_codon:yes stop_codon:yes gene_type:complete